MSDVAMDANGNFVVVWKDDRNDHDIYMRGFYKGGCERFPETRVNITTREWQSSPEVAMNANGDFVVIWEDDHDHNYVLNIYARGFNADGSQRFPDICVNSVVTGQQLRPDIAMDGSGKFIVVWLDDNDKIYARGFNELGTQTISDMTVNSNANGLQEHPVVATSNHTLSDSFVVTWSDDSDGNFHSQVLGRGLNYQDLAD